MKNRYEWEWMIHTAWRIHCDKPHHMETDRVVVEFLSLLSALFGECEF
jgi:hypothetical protein